MDRLIAVSDGLRRTYERIGVAQELFATVPNGVAPPARRMSREEARRSLGLGPDQPVVLSIGRLTHMKGHRHLIDAVPELAGRFAGLAVEPIVAARPAGHSLAGRDGVTLAELNA